MTEIDDKTVELLMKKGEDMSLYKLLEYSSRIRLCNAMFGLKDNPEYAELEMDLRTEVEKEFPGYVDWSFPPFVLNGDFKGKAIISDKIKEKYIRCFLYKNLDFPPKSK